ncbi:unnamed protein product [Diatraea saccharalis]|uniref:Uncharacterized protein n=1 Tax=Diatraea saccharalis TaxID=40085 RepID=A0A9N9WFM5_9NEOP|nr:unnamed protein product [Diatraea saccharalis]
MTEPETKQRFFYKEPENVESTVPGEQKLRESIETSELAIAGPIKGEHDKTHDAGNYVLTPVVTVTRNEASYTKGDLKLHKEIKNGVFVTTKPSAYPEIKSDVPKQPQAIRRMGDNKDVDAKKTRIPKLRFRQAVNRVRKEMRSSDGEKVPPYQRRSSIPRLKRVLSIEKEKSNNKEPSPVEDEFDKIYDEAVTVPVSLDENILNTEIDDPVKIEHSFEEIIHAYDENVIPSKDVEKPKHSKIPMLKRKSQHEIEVPKSYGKINNNNIPAERLKVQDVINRYSKIHNEETKPNNRIPTRTHIPKLSKDSNNCVENKNNYIVEEISSPMIYNVKEMDVSNSPIQHVITNSTPNVSYNTIDFFEEKAPIYNEIVELLPVREISEVEIKSEQENASIKPVKVASIKEFNMVTENLMKNTGYSIEYNMKDEEEDTERINISNVTNTFDNSVNTCDEVKEEIIVEQINLDYDKHDDDNLDEDILIKGKVSKMIRQLSSNLEHKDVKPILDEDVPKPKSVLTKIAMFEQSSPSSTFPKTQTENKTPISSVVRIDEENVHKPHIVNGKLKTPDENNENHNKNPNSTMYEENNNIVHNIICEEFNVPPLTVVDKILETEDIIFENQPVQNKFLLNEATIQNEQYFPNNLIQHHKDEIELEAAETYRIEYAHPVNSIESIPIENDSKLNQIRILDNKEDVVYVNYESNKIENSETKKYNNGLYKSHNELDSYNTEPQLLEYEGLSSKNIDSKNTNVDFKRLRTTSEHIRKEKVKSVADLELGDAVKGKVHELIYRMNSNERLNVEKKEVISAKERPRKKSVSEKIALFEGKLAVAKITSETKSPPKRSTKPQQPGPIVLQDDEVEVKIAELKAAKIKYGCTQVNKTVVLANSEEMPAIAVGTALGVIRNSSNMTN